MTTTFFTASSVDGFIADPDHSLSWLLSRDIDVHGAMGYERFLQESVGALVMGSTTSARIVEHDRLEQVVRNHDFACARCTVLREGFTPP